MLPTQQSRLKSAADVVARLNCAITGSWKSCSFREFLQIASDRIPLHGASGRKRGKSSYRGAKLQFARIVFFARLTATIDGSSTRNDPFRKYFRQIHVSREFASKLEETKFEITSGNKSRPRLGLIRAINVTEVDLINASNEWLIECRFSRAVPSYNDTRPRPGVITDVAQLSSHPLENLTIAMTIRAGLLAACAITIILAPDASEKRRWRTASSRASRRRIGRMSCQSALRLEAPVFRALKDVCMPSDTLSPLVNFASCEGTCVFNAPINELLRLEVASFAKYV